MVLSFLSIFDASFITSLILLAAVGIIIFKTIYEITSLSILNRNRICSLFMLCFCSIATGLKYCTDWAYHGGSLSLSSGCWILYRYQQAFIPQG